jgi:hypothetical protein
MGGWINMWMNGWMDVRAVLRISYTNKKCSTFFKFEYLKQLR